jgi:ubiquinone/menaquinone biosynthesis C-methylase UbiE
MTDIGLNNQSDREKWLKEVIKKIPPGQRLLDAGAGELQYKKFCAHLDYVSQDFAQYDGQGDRQGLQTTKWDQSQLDIVSDITNIPEPAASFDAVMCIEVLEHLPAPVGALKEFSRLLKPGGKLILTAPFNSLTHFSPHFYQTGYSKNFYQYWLHKLGFEIIDMQFNGNYFEYLAQELRRLPRVGIDYSRYPVNWIDRQAIKKILATLNYLSKKNNGSEELLCYGIHVLAIKGSK